MKKQLLILSIILSLPILFASCKKDRLEGSYDRIEGKYQWIYSSFSYRECALCSTKYGVDSASYADYSAQIEFDNTSCVTFYIDNKELTKKKFKIEDQSETDGTLYLNLEVNVKKSDLDIVRDMLQVNSLNADTIYISGFPGDAYNKSYNGKYYNGQNYFVRIK